MSVGQALLAVAGVLVALLFAGGLVLSLTLVVGMLRSPRNRSGRTAARTVRSG